MEDLSSLSERASAWLEQVASTAFETAVPELEVGAQLCTGRYEVQQEMGRGGMGIVYAVWDHERRERVALKTLSRGSPSSIYRIKQEFRGLAHLVHPHLVRLHELFEDNGRWCFTLELVPGETLLRALRNAPVGTIAPALRQLADGIGALHAAGKLHRDLKPTNVMLTPDQRVVILDFGLAADISAETGWVASGLSGTPGYMAPELRIHGSASPASDWYSFGVIVWELLTGRLPPGSEPSPERGGGETHHANEGAPAHLAELCRELLSTDPSSRPGAAEVTRRLGLEPGAVKAPASLAMLGAASDAHGFLGRKRELDWMRQAYAASCHGNLPVVLLLSGESGIGKTALVQSFVGELEQAWVLVGRCYERELVPYNAFDAAIDGLCRHLAQLSDSELAEVLPADFPELCRLFPVLGRVQEPAQQMVDGEDAHELRRRGFEALGTLLERLRARRPIVLWIDDLQWTDADSTHLLLHLLRQPVAPKILMMASHRSDPGAQHPCLQPLYEALSTDVRLDVRAVELGPLSRDDATALLGRVSPGAPRALVERAQGHPFLLEELSRYAARRAPGGVAWPSLEEALGARIAALPSGERQSLELLAVAGRPLPEPIARAASGPRGHASLQSLCSFRLARRDSAGGNLTCYHDAVREAALGALSEHRARQCHRALALAMLRSADAQPERLAPHLLGAGHPVRAAEQTVVAARRAEASLAFDRAAQLYQSALELGRFDAPTAHGLRVARAHALAAAGRGNEAAELYLAVLDEGDERATLELRARAAEQYLLSGRLERGLEVLRGALQSVGLPLHTTALGAISSFVYHRSRLRLRGYEFEPRPVPKAVARRLLLLQRASVALMRLDPLRASELASRALLLALQTGSAEAISTALSSDVVIGTLLRVSDAELGRRLVRAKRACARFGGPQERALLHSALATTARLKAQPDLPGALVHLERFFQVHREHVLPRASYERPWEEWARAMVRCQQGELARVAREVPARLDEAWSRGDHCIVPLWAGGDALLARLAVGDDVGAERDLARAVRVWSSRSFTLQDLMLALGSYQLQRYRGNARAAWVVAVDALKRLETSPLRRMPNAVDALLALQGHAALELATQASSAGERRRLQQLARRIWRGPQRNRNLAAVCRCQVLEAAWRYQQGDHDGSALALRHAEAHLESIPLHAIAVRYRRGLLRGDREGADWAAEAKRRLSAGGALETERLLDLLLPGYAPSRG